jgi:hypothetical protein
MTSLPAAFFAIFITLVVAHLAICVFAFANARAVAEVLAQPVRSIEAWLYLYALRQWRWDPETDLTSPGLSADIVASNVRSRAAMSTVLGLIPFAVVVFFAHQFGSAPFFR